MTLTYELDLDILKLYVRTITKLLGQKCQNLELANRIDRQIRPNALPSAFTGSSVDIQQWASARYRWTVTVTTGGNNVFPWIGHSPPGDLLS